MPEILRNLVERGVYEQRDLVSLESIYLTVCDMLDVAADDTGARQIVAKAVLFVFDRGIRDVDQIKAEAIIASKTPLQERALQLSVERNEAGPQGSAADKSRTG
ncbi:hypothetical protein [Phreatobacter sp. AB_2022a]|uniref:hypothetical protein n=1 Tax=Phreatobacter sp. AB_2022a TaxID=3003134 RepID=UPI0022876D4B|nr:hypothetical protein [Phreatobacter sp. AB_2022a]MCZ0734837.1 hypothetical protein [Phreatobacter sp. AB_2022a]